MKGISTQFIPPLLNFGALNGKFAVGEFFETQDLSQIQRWISNTSGRASAFDFTLRFQFLMPMCNQAGFFNMSQLDHAGLAGIDPFHAVTFVENHDTDRSSPIVTNKAQGYAYILTSEGYPSVFYKDYSTDDGCYKMKAVIDPLIFIHEQIAAGATQQRWKNHDVFAYERLGGAHLLVGLNNNGSSAPDDHGRHGFRRQHEPARLRQSLRRRPDRRHWAGHHHDPEKHERARVRLLFARGNRRTLSGRGARCDAAVRREPGP